MDLFVLLFIIWILKMVFGKKDQQKNKRATGKKQQGMDSYYAKESDSREGSAAAGKPVAGGAPLQAGVAGMFKQMDAYYAKRFGGQAGPSAAEGAPKRPAPAQPSIVTSVHTHMEPACDEHDQSGSMSFASTEGFDVCHEDQMTSLRPECSALTETEEKPGLELDWNGESMVKAFVMQEILTRPCDRRRRA